VQCQTIRSHVSECFASNKLALNLENNKYKMKPIICIIVTNNLPHYVFSISYKEKYTEVTLNTKFLGLQTDKE
jgi:hypothetical protein